MDGLKTINKANAHPAHFSISPFHRSSAPRLLSLHTLCSGSAEHSDSSGLRALSPGCCGKHRVNYFFFLLQLHPWQCRGSAQSHLQCFCCCCCDVAACEGASMPTAQPLRLAISPCGTSDKGGHRREQRRRGRERTNQAGRWRIDSYRNREIRKVAGGEA